MTVDADAVPELADPAQWLDALRRRLAPSRERRVVWLQGSAAFTHAWAAAATSGVDPGALLWVGSDAGQVAPHRAAHYLGREFSLLIWDARAGLHPDGFGALAGTLAGGGVLLLLTPDASAWSSYADPDYQRLGHSQPAQPASIEPGAARSFPPKKLFLERTAGLLRRDPQVLRITEDERLPPLPEVAAAVSQALPTVDQRRALAAIMKVRQGHRRRPLVITADRGRGKSAALGIAAAQLLAAVQSDRDTPLEIIVTAARPQALASFWRHAGVELNAVALEKGPICLAQGRIRFMAPDELLESDAKADLLLVDEAAMLPVPMLSLLLERYARVVFASTVHGYEGSGRGFALRFATQLAKVRPHWRGLELTQPIRWSARDPLEPLLNRLLLLDADLAEIAPEPAATERPSAAERSITVQAWPRNARIADEKRLGEVFGLLVNAHYQTTPDDLRLLLDDPLSHCWLALQKGIVVGAVWVRSEGGLDDTLAAAVRRGQRRTRGHLLPQALAAYGGDTEAATLRYWRLVRVAVHPQCRRRGIGRQLVAATNAAAREAGIECLGTSFGVEPALLTFWRSCGMTPLRLGLSSDAASGAPSLFMGQGLAQRATEMCTRQNRRFAEHWPLLLGTDLRSLDPSLVWALSANWAPPVLWTAQDALEVDDFVNGNRPLGLTRLPLQRLTWRCLAVQSDAIQHLDHSDDRLVGILRADAGLWCRAVLQQADNGALQAEGYSSGRKQTQARLRSAAGRLLAELTPTERTITEIQRRDSPGQT